MTDDVVLREEGTRLRLIDFWRNSPTADVREAELACEADRGAAARVRKALELAGRVPSLPHSQSLGLVERIRLAIRSNPLESPRHIAARCGCTTTQATRVRHAMIASGEIKAPRQMEMLR